MIGRLNISVLMWRFVRLYSLNDSRPPLWSSIFFFLTGNREFKEGESSKQDFCVSLIVCRFFDGRELGKPFSNICQLAASIPIPFEKLVITVSSLYSLELAGLRIRWIRWNR